MHLLRASDRALLLVDLEAQAALQELPERGHDPYPGSLAAHEDVGVIGIADKAQTAPRQFLVELVQDDVRQKWREWPALRGAFRDGDACAVRHHHGGLQHPAHEVEDASVGDPLAHTIQQALMMNTVKELRQVQVNHRPIARFQISGRFGNRRVGTTVRTETVTAGVEGWFVNRLQDLEHGLLNHPCHHVRNAKPTLAAAGLGNPNPPDVARTEAFRQQITAQRSQQARSLRFRLLDRLAIDPWCTLVAYYVQQRPCEIGLGRHLLQQPIGIGRPGGGTCPGFALRCVQQPRAMLGYVRASPSPPPCGLSANAKPN